MSRAARAAQARRNAEDALPRIVPVFFFVWIALAAVLLFLR
jgi:hypothetical protein